MTAVAPKIMSNGDARTGKSITDTGFFIDFETTYSSKASYFTVKNLGATYPLLINFNTTTGAADVTAAINKTVVVAPEASIDFTDENISNATLFCASGETTTANYLMGKRNFMRGGS